MFDYEKLLRESLISAMTEWHEALIESGTDIPLDGAQIDLALAKGSSALKEGGSMQDALEVSLLGYYAFLAREHPALAPSLTPVVAQLREKNRHLLQGIAEES